jgi:hypothetical protein
MYLSKREITLSLFYQTVTIKIVLYCGVMKFLADMPPCLGGEDHRINVA